MFCLILEGRFRDIYMYTQLDKNKLRGNKKYLNEQFVF